MTTKPVRRRARTTALRDTTDALLDAAEFCFEEIGLSATTMEDIARQAGVSRATVYRHFANRESVVSGVILRTASRYLGRIRGPLAGQPDLGSAVLAFVEITVRAATRDKSIAVLFVSDDRLAGIGLTENTSVALFELVTEFLRPVFARHSNDLQPGISVDDAAEWILRTILSLLTVRGPRRRSPDGLQTYLRRYLLPAIVVPGAESVSRHDDPAGRPCARYTSAVVSP
ncbi:MULTISPECIES: TetR/AcrR family transcriptional regulator [Nocardia]|uniref:TetR/AcrR family transcriptional regulator n=1 Tax=Nocardia TaxID=1817 RepID=UPI002B4B807D|nr:MULTISPECIES: TetR/AcrR family transcriptional regulator [Nocardia]